MIRCKACDFMRNEAYFSYAARTNDEYNAADERFRGTWAGCSKMVRCKTCEVMRDEAYFTYAAKTNDKHNEADGCFRTA